MPIDLEEGLYEYAKFSGLRNTVPVDQFGLDDLDAAANIDIDDAKRATLRKGHAAAMRSGPHSSIWANSQHMLALSGGSSLVRLLPDYAVLRAGLSPGLDVSFTAVGARTYYSNGAETGVIEAGRSRTWGLDVPTEQPIATAIGGVLAAGIYQFALTFLRVDHQESGTLEAGVIELTSEGGVRLDSIMPSSDPDVIAMVIYFSKRNDDTLYRAGVLPTSANRFTYQMSGPGRVPLITQHLRPAPAGQIVDNLNGGRTLVAQGNVLFYSEPYALELFDLRKKFTFETQITLLSCLDSGCFLGTEEYVTWLQGPVPEKWEFAPKLNYGAVLGASTQCSRDMVLDGQGTKPVAIFATTHGLCLGLDGGEIINLNQERFLWPIQPKGCAVVRRHRGMVQTIIGFQGAEVAPKLSS